MRWIVAVLFGALFFMARPQIHWETQKNGVEKEAPALPSLSLPVRGTVTGRK